MDGHEKVLVKCGTALAKQRSGRPRATGIVKPYGHGWFMIVDPASGRVLSVVSQDDPENNLIASQALGKVLFLYPNVNCLIYDRNCSFMPAAQKNSALCQIQFWSIDLMHAYGHGKICACNPRVHKRLKSRLMNVNTSVCEQTFSWFRNYSKIFNDMRENRHRFAVLLFCSMHNQLVDNGATAHLNPFSKRHADPVCKPYGCGVKSVGVKDMGSTKRSQLKDKRRIKKTIQKTMVKIKKNTMKAKAKVTTNKKK